LHLISPATGECNQFGQWNAAFRNNWGSYAVKSAIWPELVKSDRFLVDVNGFIGYRHSYCKRDNQGWVFAMAKTIFAGTVEKTGKNRGKN